MKHLCLSDINICHKSISGNVVVPCFGRICTLVSYI